MTRLEWLLWRCGITRPLTCGIVTGDGATVPVRDAHVRDFECVVLQGGCADFTAGAHDIAIASLRPLCRIARVGDIMAEPAPP